MEGSSLQAGEPPSATPADHDHDQEELSDDCSDVACGSHANDWDFDSDHDADAAYNYGDDSRLDAIADACLLSWWGSGLEA